MIEIQGLRKSYRKFEVLKGLDMTVAQGEVYGFIGRNGCGKSTTMNILTGLLAKDGGSVKVNGQEVTAAGRVPVGYLPESPSLFEYMTCRQYLDYIGAACEHPDIMKRTAEVIDIIGLRDAADRKVGGFSRGMKQRVGIGAAIYANYDIVILDEPTSALDPQGRAEVMQIIETLKGMGKTVLLSTHILTDVERVADRVGILNNGMIAETGTLRELYQKYAGDTAVFELSAASEPLCGRLLQTGFVASLRTDQRTFYVQFSCDLEEGGRLLLDFLAKQPEQVIRFELQSTSLEQIYMKVCAAQPAGNGGVAVCS